MSNIEEAARRFLEASDPDEDGCSCARCMALRDLETALASPPAESTAARDVLAERKRQVAVEGWTPEHDDEHGNGEMARAAGCYAIHASGRLSRSGAPLNWPWDLKWWKPKTPRRDLVKAGALILAEIERLDRAAPPSPREGQG